MDAFLGDRSVIKAYLGSELIIGTETPPMPSLDLAPAEDVPVVTTAELSQWGPPSIVGSEGWWREKRTDFQETAVGDPQTATSMLDVGGSSYFRYPGVPTAIAHPANPGGYVMTDYKPGGDPQNARWLFNVSFTTASPTVELRFRSAVTNPDLGLVLVNGKRTQERTVTQTLGEAGIGYSTTLTFPTEAERTITIYGLNSVSGNFGGVAVEAGHTVSKPTPLGKTVAIIGDSYVNGHDTVAASETFAWRFALAMGAGTIIQAGIGGTGWAKILSGQPDSNFVGRISDVLGFNPDILIFAGGRNDTAAGLQAAVEDVLSQVPDGPTVYVLPTASESTQGSVRTAMAAACTARGVPYLDVAIDALDKITDGIHPTWEAHQQLADQAYALCVNPAPALVALTTATQQSGTGIDVPVPAAAEAGDLLIVAHGDQSNVTDDYNGNPGWTRLGPEFVSRSAEGRVIGLWAKWHTGDEPATYEFVRTGSATRSVAAMMAWRGVALDYLDAAVTDYDGIDITNGKETEAMTATRNGVQVFFARAEFTDGHSSVPTSSPAAFVEAANWQTGTGTTASRSGGWLGYRTATAGDTGTSSIVWGAPSAPSAQSLILRGQQEAQPVQPYTIADMDADLAADQPVYWAHRGGSANWSEMTLYAYRNAVAFGAKCLEFSARRTSDGVWVGCHDATLDRVTGLTGSVDSFTWSQIEGVGVDAPSPGGVLTRVEDFLAEFTDQVLLIDPKSNGWGPIQLFPLLQTVPDWQNRIILKLDGRWEQVSVFETAKSMGFKVAGYWYPSNYAESLPDRAEYTDYIGMQWDATEQQWADVLAYGKPVWGHVLQNQSQLDASAAGGASIFQCANVIELIPS